MRDPGFESPHAKAFLSLPYLLAPLLSVLGLEVEGYVLTVVLLFLTVYGLDIPKLHNPRFDPAEAEWLRIDFALYASFTFMFADRFAYCVGRMFELRPYPYVIPFVAQALAWVGLLVLWFLLHVEWPSFRALKTDRILLSRFVNVGFYSSFLGLGGAIVVQFAVFPLIVVASVFRGFPNPVTIVLSQSEARSKIWKAFTNHKTSPYYDWIRAIPYLLSPLLFFNLRYLEAKIAFNIGTQSSVVTFAINQWQLAYMGLVVSAILVPMYILTKEPTKRGAAITLGVFLSSVVVGLVFPSAVPITAFLHARFPSSDVSIIFVSLTSMILGILLYSFVTDRASMVTEGIVAPNSSEAGRLRRSLTVGALMSFCLWMIPSLLISKRLGLLAALYFGLIGASVMLMVYSSDHISLDHVVQRTQRDKGSSYLWRGFSAGGMGLCLTLLLPAVALMFGYFLSLNLKGLFISALMVSAFVATYRASSIEQSKTHTLILEGIVLSFLLSGVCTLWLVGIGKPLTGVWTANEMIRSVGLVLLTGFLGGFLRSLFVRFRQDQLTVVV